MNTPIESLFDPQWAPYAPKTLDELPAFAQMCRESGFPDVGDYMEEMYHKLKWHTEREWDGSPKNPTTTS